MHKMGLSVSMCNTLSRSYYGSSHFQDQRTTHYPLYKATMLDDRAAGSRTKIFHSIGSPIPYRSEILWQLYPKWKVVYTLLDSQLQSGRTLVPPRGRLFPCRQFNQNVDRPYCKELCGSNCRTIRRKTPLSVSYNAGSVAQEENTWREDVPFVLDIGSTSTCLLNLTSLPILSSLFL